MNDVAAFSNADADRGMDRLGAGDTVPEWQFRVAGEIVNFDELRRRLGCIRANVIVDEVVDRLAAGFANMQIQSAGRRHIDIEFAGSRAIDLEQGIDRLADACTALFNIDGKVLNLQIVFGGAAALRSVDNDVRLIERAEEALAKERAGNRTVKRGCSTATANDSVKLTKEIQRAIERNELFMQYQPKVNVRRQNITSAEGLVRWHHPTRGIVHPADFIPVAERSHLIEPITLWTIKRAIADQLSLASRGHDLRLFINISGRLLADASFVHAACKLVAATDAKLGFEITETSVIRDPQHAIDNLQTFANYGIVIAIDDYGAGLSSLSYLKRLPARELKIDRLFVTQLTSSNRDPLIVRSTIDLAHALEMQVVAEGVETPAAMALLTVMGCDMVQGFLISRPIGLDALTIFLNEGRHLQPEIDRGRFLGTARVKVAG